MHKLIARIKYLSLEKKNIEKNIENKISNYELLFDKEKDTSNDVQKTPTKEKKDIKNKFLGKKSILYLSLCYFASKENKNVSIQFERLNKAFTKKADV